MKTRDDVAIELIEKWEKYTGHPYVIPESPASGITIDPGVDLGRQTRKDFEAMYGGLIAPDDLRKLGLCLGLRGQGAAAMFPGVKSITIPHAVAQKVFRERVLPIYQAKVNHAFPGILDYPEAVQGAFDSLVYNRGEKMDDPAIPFDGREEMTELRQLVMQRAECQEIGNKIDEMAHLWQDMGLDGLIARRHDEAEVVRAADDPPGLT